MGSSVGSLLVPYALGVSAARSRGLSHRSGVTRRRFAAAPLVDTDVPPPSVVLGPCWWLVSSAVLGGGRRPFLRTLLAHLILAPLFLLAAPAFPGALRARDGSIPGASGGAAARCRLCFSCPSFHKVVRQIAGPLGWTKASRTNRAVAARITELTTVDERKRSSCWGTSPHYVLARRPTG